jgi:hypothetical protein
MPLASGELLHYNIYYADVVKLVYTYALGAYAFGRAGSSPVIRTKRRLGVIEHRSKGLFPDKGRGSFVI